MSASPSITRTDPGSLLPIALTSLQEEPPSSNPDMGRIERVKSAAFQLNPISPDQYEGLRLKVKKWKKIVEKEKETNKSFYFKYSFFLEDSNFINEMARFEMKHSSSGTTVWTCTKEKKLSGILLFKENQSYLEKGKWIHMTFLFSHPDNVICRLKKEDSFYYGAGTFLIEELKKKAFLSQHDGIFLEASMTSSDFYKKREFREEKLSLRNRMFWECPSTESRSAEMSGTPSSS